MRNFEFSTARSSQGLYAKYLLKHLADAAPVSQVFQRVASSFTKAVDKCIEEEMGPEYRNACKQDFCLISPMRSRKPGPGMSGLKTATNRHCAANRLDGGGHALSLGLAAENGEYSWSHGENEEGALPALSLRLKTERFANEATLAFKLELGRDCEAAGLTATFQVVLSL